MTIFRHHPIARRQVLAGGIAGFATAIFVTPLMAAQAATLLIDGDIAAAGGTMQLTDTALSALPQIAFATSTIWTTGEIRFSGPALAAVLQAGGAGTGDLMLHATNDYNVKMPRDMIEAEAPIIATRIGGQPISLRDKGPFWVVFPYDTQARFRSDLALMVSVWQLIEISVLQK